jgi:hypothetical protein
MLDLCMFDLDDTLVRTGDMKAVREACKNSVEPAHLRAVQAQLLAVPNRHIYSLDLLQQIRKAHPNLKLGVFTRAPRSYAATVLAWAYPGFAWDAIFAYEDVPQTKPYGDGIGLAMDKFGFRRLSRVMMVGDNGVDVRAAYNCGCLVTLDKSAWQPYPWLPEYWWALEKVPDAIIDAPIQLLEVLAEWGRHLPELERLLANASESSFGNRFDKINHFVPKEVGGDKTAYPVFVCGRSFANYDSISQRKKWHALTKSIEAQKDAKEFPDAWVQAIRRFIMQECFAWRSPTKVLVAVVPHRPERAARLESLLAQLQRSIADAPIAGRDVSVVPDLLAYRKGVKSQHLEFLKKFARFENVRDHLFVNRPDLVQSDAMIVIIDDVCTTGASLIYAAKYLGDAGAGNVKCLALAKNVGDVL